MSTGGNASLYVLARLFCGNPRYIDLTRAAYSYAKGFGAARNREWRRTLSAIVSVLTVEPRDVAYYQSRLSRFPMLSHVTVEVRRPAVNLC